MLYSIRRQGVLTRRKPLIVIDGTTFGQGRKERTQMNIYVGNLPFSAAEDELKELFSAYGQVDSVSLIKDKYTGQSRGFGFVEMPNLKEAQAAVAGLNGKEFMGRNLTVNPAKPREERKDSYSSGGSRGYDNKRRSTGNKSNRSRSGY
jgi:RNA recognition motif-containing protein